MVNEEKVDLLAKKIVSYLDKEPEVSSDISARLEFSRNLALKKIKQPVLSLPWYKKISRYVLTTNVNQKVLWLTSATLALAILSLSSDLIKVSEDDGDEITYHRQAEKLPSYIVEGL